MVNAAPLHSFDCSREGLAYISGFLALKLSADFPDLGAKTSEISHIVGPSKFPWLSALSRGGLVQPSDNFFAQVEKLEELFHEYYGSGISTEPGLIKDFAGIIMSRFPSLHSKIALKFSKVRTFIRIKFLNHQLQEQKSKLQRRHLNQVGHFLC